MADNAAIKAVYCGGKPVVQNGRHVARDAIVSRFHRVQR
jgi:formimidoylglutamate deiminase